MRGLRAGHRARRIAAIAVAVLAASMLCACSGSTVSTRLLPTFSQPCSRHETIAAPEFAMVPLKLGRLVGPGPHVTAAVCVNGRGPFTFLVDSGSTLSLIDASIARQVTTFAGNADDLCDAADHGVQLEQVSDMTIGPRRVQPALFGVVNLRTLYGNLAGVLGADTLRSFGFVRIDYRRLTMTMGLPEPPDPATTPGTTKTRNVPKRFRAGTVAVVPMRVFNVGSSSNPATLVASTVPISIAGHRYQFRVDTGAAVTALSPAVMRALSTKSQQRMSVILAGCRQPATSARLSGWRVGDDPLPASTVLTTSIPSDISGLFGADLLAQRSPIVLDYTDGSLLLGRQHAPAQSG
jgi:predicted aspartyl protease